MPVAAVAIRAASRWGLPEPRSWLTGTLVDRAVVSVRGIERHQPSHYAVGPSKAVLQRIFAAAPGSIGRGDIILLDELACLAIDARHVGHPAAGDLLRQSGLPVAAETREGDPLQGRPPVRRIPLLPGVNSRGHDPAGRE